MTTPGRHVVSAALVGSLLFAGLLRAQIHSPQNPEPGDFIYYLLALSYAPDFCDQPGGSKDPRECDPKRHVGFVVHGLWPQGESSRSPEKCAWASPVSKAITQLMLNYMPTESLIQHEWATHGTCSGLSTADYFAAVRKAHDAIAIPPDLAQLKSPIKLSPAQLEAKFAEANPKAPKTAFRTACYRNGELEEVRVCMDKNLSPIACGRNVSDCPYQNLDVMPIR